MKLKILFGVLLLCCITPSFAARDYTTISQGILERKLEHPYLVFDNQSKQEMLDRIAANPTEAQIFDLLQQQGRRLLLTTVEPEPFLDNDANVYNETFDFEHFVGYYREGAKLLAFLYQMTGDEAYAQKAFHYADRLCEMTYWVLGLHRYKVIHKRVWPWGAGDDQVVFTFDLHTSEIALALGLVYDWIYPAMDKEQRNRIRSGLLENAILRVRGNYDYFWWSGAYRCNWSASCYGGLGIAALALLTEDPKLIDVVARSCEGMEKNLEQYGSDNGWAEGRHYSIYGLRESIAFIDAIKRLTDGEVNLFQVEGWQHPADFGLYGMTGTFNDGFSPGPIGYSYFYNKFIAENPDPAAMYYLEKYFSDDRRSMNFWELIWPRPTIQAEKPTVASKYFPSIDWAFMRKDFGEENLQVAIKCAPMNDPHHGHLDAGSFILSWQGDILVGEMDQKVYDQFFFTEDRWKYLHVRSLSHNVVHVNGEEQIPCKHKDQPWIEGLGGKIDKFYTSPTFDYTLMDPTNAYPKQEMKGWKRAMVLDKRTNAVIVLDRITCEKGAKIDLLFHPRVDVTINDGHSVSLQGKHTSMEMQPLINSPYEVSLQKQYVVRVVKNDPMQIVPCIFTSLQAPAKETIVATVFYPSDQKSTAQEFTLDESSTNPIVRYTLGDQTYSWEFAPNEVKAL